MQRPSAVVLIIIDGISDSSPILSMAATPTMDRAAKRGRVGLMDPVRAGLACGSDTAHLSMFGYNPFECYRGRGAFEAMGAGMDIVGADVAFKCNFARMNEKGIVTTRCAGRGVEMEKLAMDLVQQLDGMVVEGIEVGVLYAGKHRCVVRLRGEGLSDRVSNTDPLLDGRKLQFSKALEKGAEKCARVVNALSDKMRMVLEGWKDNVLGGVRPGTNVVLLRGASGGIDVQRFQDRYGISAFLIAPTKIIAGVGKTVGMDMIRVKGGTGGYDTDLDAKARSCVDALMQRENGGWKWQLGVVHVKAVDEAGHEQDSDKKKLWLEKIDAMFADVMRLLYAKQRRDIVTVLTGDHTTSSAFGDHTCEPVPVVFADVFDPDTDKEEMPVFVPSDDCVTFDEVAAGMHGSLGRFPGDEFIGLIKRLLFASDSC